MPNLCPCSASKAQQKKTTEEGLAICYAVLVVKYKNNLEPNATAIVNDEAALESEINKFMERTTVECIEVHKLARRIQRVEKWETEDLS